VSVANNKSETKKSGIQPYNIFRPYMPVVSKG
jgi:hypothetical protein